MIFNICFIENYSIEKAFIEFNSNKHLFNGKTVSKNGVIKIYKILRNKIMCSLHNIWKDTLLGDGRGDQGYSSIEIGESEVVGNNNIIYWMFGLIVERTTKEVRVFVF